PTSGLFPQTRVPIPPRSPSPSTSRLPFAPCTRNRRGASPIHGTEPRAQPRATPPSRRSTMSTPTTPITAGATTATTPQTAAPSPAVAPATPATTPFRASYERARDALAAVPASDLIKLNLDLSAAVTIALGALPALRALRARIAHELPGFDLTHLDNLETYA